MTNFNHVYVGDFNRSWTSSPLLLSWELPYHVNNKDMYNSSSTSVKDSHDTNLNDSFKYFCIKKIFLAQSGWKSYLYTF
jgi:hypothetical protein